MNATLSQAEVKRLQFYISTHPQAIQEDTLPRPWEPRYNGPKVIDAWEMKPRMRGWRKQNPAITVDQMFLRACDWCDIDPAGVSAMSVRRWAELVCSEQVQP